MYGLRIECDQELSEILKPLRKSLDDCWWYLGGAGVQLPLQQGLASNDELNQQSLDYAQWMDDESGYRVGKPGWFSRYIDYVDMNWALYFACESSSTEIPREILDWLDSFLSKGVSWFGDAKNWPLPPEVVMVCRDVDAAYWDLFFREEALCKSIQEHLQKYENVECAPFVEPPVN